MFFSGIGGQVDFVRGASRAPGGKAIIALPSSAAGETVSRIVPTLKEGAGVVTSRGDVHYVVTEYGAAYLHGKSIRERAVALIEIAHPKFRPWLMGEAKTRHIVYTDQLETQFSTPTYPEEVEQWVSLNNESRVWVRPLRVTDESQMRELFYSLSSEAVYHRFFQAIKAMPHKRLQKFLQVDYQAEMAIVATTGKDEYSKIIGVGRYVLNPQTNFAEAAFLVADDYQGRGLGKALLGILIESAKSNGIQGFVADVMADNSAMIKVFHHVFDKIESQLQDAVFHLEMTFD